ncbi:MAG: large conductance mechanosensitive channel protein MscL [Candidatus Pacebacteria bacterium]|nr:large conductance mechanosensitive channel protein MscL [Candidatus Paceibacterota bacterium]MCD8527845.1 large conductance mechanosensitive channel protein MscL [Candidatus Paceibacterota bacterium]MCD8563517.1 large conductance mechanosensitive channel protein MscL [Candidatus Paceibacterota bacterium]
MKKIKLLDEFKSFAVKGNMVDMAVGIMIGAAFGTLVKSIVDDIVMPIISGVFRIPDFSNLFFVIGQKSDEVFTSVAAARAAGEAVFAYGLFINAAIAFLLVAWVLFLVIKGINTLKRAEEAKQEEKPKGPSEIDVLMEIRDALKK